MARARVCVSVCLSVSVRLCLCVSVRLCVCVSHPKAIKNQWHDVGTIWSIKQVLYTFTWQL